MGKSGRDLQHIKFCAYGFLRNLRFFEAFLIIYLLSRGITYTQIGLLYALREISANILEIPSGITADVLGRRRSLAGSFLAYILSFLIFYLFSDPILYGIAFFLYGAGEAFRSGTHKGMIADYLKARGEKDKMTAYYGVTRSWSQLGLALSSLLAGGIVLLSGNLEGIFLFSVIPYLINFLLILSYPADLDKSSKGKKEGRKQRFKDVIRESAKTLTDRKVLHLLNLSALHTAYLKAMKDYIQPLLLSLAVYLPLSQSLTEESRAALLIGIVYFVIYFLSSRASYMAGKLKKGDYARIPFLSLLAGLTAGALGGLLHLAGLTVLSIVLFTLVHLMENLRKPVMTGFISDNVDTGILTSVLSVQSQLKTLFTALIALLFGIVADRFGVGWSLLSVSTALVCFSLLLKMIARNRR